MSLYVFSTEAENDLMEIYRYGFLNYVEYLPLLKPPYNNFNQKLIALFVKKHYNYIQ